MSTRPNQPDDRESGSNPAAHPCVLVVASTPARRTALVRAMRAGDVACGCVGTMGEAAVVLGEPLEAGLYDALLIDLPDCTDEALEGVRALARHEVPALLVCPVTDLDQTVAALRAGASDVIPAGLRPRELSRRVRSALGRRPAENARAARPRATDSILPAHPETAMALGNPAASSRPRQERPDTLAEAASRFGALIRGELDVETLLRQLLEFILAHAGPTNAAVFLPGSSGDFSLGAYVNYTCPKETVEVLLDHLANVAAPRLEHTVGVLGLTNEDQLRDRIGDGADWLGDNHMLAFTCRDPGDAEAECLAVVTLFRDQRTPFDPVLHELAGRLGPVFGQQLGRVVRIHHRHLPKDKWTALGDPIDDSSDQGGLAA